MGPTILYRFCSQYLDSVLDTLSSSSSLQEVLWNFCCFKNDSKRLTLRDNPHFYAELPTSPDAYVDSLEIDPTEDFRHGNKFYVLSDKPEPVHIMTDQVSQSFGNIWCPKDAIIFKGLGVLFLLLHLFLMSEKTYMEGSGGKALSRHLLQAPTVGSVSSTQYRLWQELPQILVDCNRLSQRDARGWAGVRLAVSQYILLLISAYEYVLGKWHPIIRYAVTLSHLIAFANIDLDSDPLATKV